MLLVCIPKFNTSSTCVLVNLRTLDCQPLKFSVGLPEPEPTERETVQVKSPEGEEGEGEK